MRIAVVEDDIPEAIRTKGMLIKLLAHEQSGVTVSTFADAEAFLSRYTAGSFDLVLLDCVLGPGKDGLSIAREIRRRNDEVPIMFATSTPDFAVEGYEVAACAYILKPITFDALAAALKRGFLEVPSSQRTYVELGHARMPLDELSYCESSGHYLEVHRVNAQSAQKRTRGHAGADEPIRLRMRFRDLADALAPYSQIWSPARGYLVNLDLVDRIEGQDLVMRDHQRIPISRQRLAATRNAYSDRRFERMREES